MSGNDTVGRAGLGGYLVVLEILPPPAKPKILDDGRLIAEVTCEIPLSEKDVTDDV